MKVLHSHSMALIIRAKTLGKVNQILQNVGYRRAGDGDASDYDSYAGGAGNQGAAAGGSVAGELI